MALQTSIPGAVPPAARILSARLAILFDEEQLIVYSAADPIYTCRRDDQDGLRLAAGMLSHLKLAKDKAIAEALGINRETVRRNRNLFLEGGVEALRSRKTGPKAAFKLTEELRLLAQDHLDEGWTIRRTARELGLSEGALRYASRQGKLKVSTQRRGVTAGGFAVHAGGSEGLGPTGRAVEDQACEQGIAVKRRAERTLACTGKLVEALPVFQWAEGVPGAGVLLALPSLLNQGLIEVGREVYGSLRNGYYGLRSVLLTFCFMALLRIKTPEQLRSEERRVERV